MSIRKRFDKKLFDKTDKPAKEAIKRLFKGFKGWSVKDNENRYGVDLLVFKDGVHVCNIETEMKLVWKGDDFPYDSLHIPERKKRYKDLEVPTLFVVFNSDCSNFLVIFGYDLYNAKLVEVPNKYVFRGEKFYNVNIKKTIKNSLRGPMASLAMGAKNFNEFEKSSVAS